MTGLSTIQIMRRTGESKTRVRRWQDRFMQEGVDGLQSAAIAARGYTSPACAANAG
jgi:transposase